MKTSISFTKSSFVGLFSPITSTDTILLFTCRFSLHGKILTIPSMVHIKNLFINLYQLISLLYWHQPYRVETVGESFVLHCYFSKSALFLILYHMHIELSIIIFSCPFVLFILCC